MFASDEQDLEVSMKYHDSNAESQEKMQSALRLLDEHSLAYNPLNYAVAYEYVSGVNRDLIDSLNEYIETKSVDPYAFESLYREYISNRIERDEASVYQLSETIDNLNSANSTSASTVGKLDEKVQSIISENGEIGMLELRQVVDELKSSQARMNKFIKEAQEQTQTIKDELATAKMEALTDPLTKLLNRHGLKKMFDFYIQDLSKSQLHAAIVDIDHFKKFNDEFGHLIGDVILRRIAKLLQEVMDSAGEAFRYGGEEFLILIPDTDLNSAHSIVEEIRSRVEKLRFVSAKTKEKLPRLTISGGVSGYVPGEAMENLISRADEALYKAKNEGRNQVVCASPQSQVE